MMTQQGSEQQATLVSPQKLNIDWQQVCQAIWQNSLSITPLITQPKETETQSPEIHLSLGLIQHNHSKNRWDSSHGESLEQSHQNIVHKYTQKEFCEQILSLKKSQTQGRRLAIIGEPSTGKTTILSQVVSWILDNTNDLPIWISMAEMGDTPLRQYLQEKWLKRVARTQDELTREWQNSLDELLESGRVWLLLDGVEQMPREQIQKLATTIEATEIDLKKLLNPLSNTIQQLQGWTEKVKVILTCGSELASVDQKALSGFDVFRPLELTYPEDVKPFITRWFSYNASSKTHNHSSKTLTHQSQKSSKLAAQLFQALDEFGYHRIQELVKTPLPLALLCRQLQKNKGKIPTTAIRIYEHLVAQYYQWQEDTTPVDSDQQHNLNKILGKLAVQALDNSNNPSWLYHHQINQEIGEDDSLLELALRLKWLRAIAITQDQELVYSFCDETFQAYFAATAINDWQFFLNHPLGNINAPSSSLTSSYRIFSPQWKRVIVLWMGKVNIPKEDKEAFLQALVEFADGCETDNLYGKRAYFLAASSLAEFSDSQKTNEILLELLQWSFFEAQLSPIIAQAAKDTLLQTDRKWAIPALIQLLTTIKNETIKREIFKTLEKIAPGNPQVVAALSEMLETHPTDSVPHSMHWQIAETLGKIDPGNSKAVATILNLLETPNNEETRQLAFNTLEKIGKGNFKAITTLIKLIQETDSPTIARRAFEIIETIGSGNATAIAALVQLIRTNSDAGIRRQAAETLEKIDPGNPTAITVLVQLVNNGSNEEIQKQAVYSVGEISPGIATAINALIKMLSPEHDVFLRWIAISSLGKIGIGNPQAISALINVIKTDEQELLRKDAIDSLSKIDPYNSEVITALVGIIESSRDECTRREAAETLGKIALGNKDAIAVLTELIKTTSDEFTRQEAAASLGKINPGNLEALKTLIQLIQSGNDLDVRSLAAETLGNVGAKNPAVIAVLIRLIKTSTDAKALRRAALSLGKIGRVGNQFPAPGNKEVISALIQLVKSASDESCRLQAAESLINLLTHSQMSEVVSALKEVLSDPQKRKDLACQKLIWHCALHLSYPEFYQAWHNRPLYGTQKSNRDLLPYPNPSKDDSKNSEEPTPTTPQLSSHNTEKPTSKTLSKLLQSQIDEHDQLSQTVHLVFIDSNNLIDTAHPFVDIYDLMLAQKCPKFEDGIPDSMAKLRLYWNTINRNENNKNYLLIFSENSSQSEPDFSPEFLKMLSKFPGMIAIITEQSGLTLQHFSPNDAHLVKNIIKWIRTYVDSKK